VCSQTAAADLHFWIDLKRCLLTECRTYGRMTSSRPSVVASPCGSGSRRFAPGVAPVMAPMRHRQLASPPVRVTIPDASGVTAATVSLRPSALGPASRLRRRYADAPAGAPRGAPSAPAGARRRFPPASKSGLLAAFIFQGDPRLYEPRTQRGHASCRAGLQPSNFESGGLGFKSLRARQLNSCHHFVFSVTIKIFPD
jgi:hypothetical protein